MRPSLFAVFVMFVGACHATPTPTAAPPPTSSEPAWRAVVIEPPPSESPPPPPVAKEPTEHVEDTTKRYSSPVLAEDKPRPSRLAPGTYACRVDAMYKLRPCEVTKDDRGFSHIAMPGSLTGLEGVLYDDGAEIVIDGSSLDRRPFGCFTCDERCREKPASCQCEELPLDASRECLALPSVVHLKKVGAIWRGSVKHESYFSHYEGEGASRHVQGFDKQEQSFVVEIHPRR